jgi:hypothetical protein
MRKEEEKYHNGLGNDEKPYHWPFMCNTYEGTVDHLCQAVVVTDISDFPTEISCCSCCEVTCAVSAQRTHSQQVS